jgi:hypothetical protein
LNRLGGTGTDTLASALADNHDSAVANGRSAGNDTPSTGKRAPWRSVGTAAASAGAPAAIAVLHPLTGAAIAIIEMAVALTIIGTALFGSRELSERAFRLLRWIGSRPEPPSPLPSLRMRETDHASPHSKGAHTNAGRKPAQHDTGQL